MKSSALKDGHWHISFWLIFDSNGGVRLTRGEPGLARNERGMSMTARLPGALFRTPTLSGTMTIEAPEPVLPPIDITAAAEALKAALGVDIDLQINDHPLP